MKKYFILLFFISITCMAQVASLENLRTQFEAFEYENVIRTANDLLASAEISDSQKVDIYEILAVSYYSINNENAAKESFAEILKLRSNYTPSPLKMSPVIIPLFEEVKKKFNIANRIDELLPGNVNQKPVIKYIDNSANIFKNLVLPGWGHLGVGNTAKSIIYSGLSLINIGLIVYYSNDTNKKQDAYLNESNRLLIEAKYNEYNNAYKTRNLYAISYAVIWAVSQLDLLFFSDNQIIDQPISLGLEKETVRFSLSFPLN
ncbi:hypothetical protein APF79_03235 [bacterium BRH_c32]|nr:MAG: hypothetical protein APF79_03235 [bacterium BRH_c32]